MKTFVVSAVSIVLVGILFCPMVMSAPSMPPDLQIVQPDPSLPKELSAFFGKWEGRDGLAELFLIIEKIDEQKASIYRWQSIPTETVGSGWSRREGNVIKERGKYIIWFRSPFGTIEFTLKGEYLNASGHGITVRYRRAP